MKNNQDNIVIALRVYGASHVRLTRAFADSLGLHATDAAALSEIIYCEDRGQPTSPAELAAKLSLSKPALSACINRLESAGHVLRSRESKDRRVIFLRCDPKIYHHAETFFIPLSDEMDKIIAKLSENELKLIEQFLLESSEAIKKID